jgi:plastocyanin
VAKTSNVQLEDYRFNPGRITVATGTKVTFSNAGMQPHNASSSSDGGGWDTGLLARGESATVTFNQPGTYSFSCTPHPSMIGQIIVTGPALGSVPAAVVEPPAGRSTETKPPMPADHGAH